MAQIIWSDRRNSYDYNPNSIRNIGTHRNAMPYRHVIAKGNIIEGVEAKA